MPSQATNDSEARALLTVNATGIQGGVNWSASMTDNNPGFTGFQSSGASWTITMAGTVVTSASNRSYDYGTGNVSNPYFPRSESGFLALSPGTYTASGVYDTTLGVVGDASVSFSFTVPPLPNPVWTTGTTLSAGVRNRSLSRTVVASPVTSYSLVSSSGATGLSLNTSTGVISGTPTDVGTASLTIRAFNGASSTDRTFTMVIAPTPPKVWNGSAFIDGAINVWNGTAFIGGRIRVWNGSAWVDNT